MIISHKHKFIFVKTQKTAGTSIEIALSKICGAEDIITPISPKDEKKRYELTGKKSQNCYVKFSKYKFRDWMRFLLKGERLHFFNHMNASTIKKFVDVEVWENYYKFTIERNPWDKFISFYYWRRKNENVTIPEFIDSGVMKSLKGFNQYSAGGVILVDKIYEFENLDEALRDVSSILKLEDNMMLPTYRAKGNRKKEKNYREYFTEEDKKRVEVIFAREICLLGYKL